MWVTTRVFNKARQPAKLAGYSTWTHRLFDWEITSYFTTNMSLKHSPQNTSLRSAKIYSGKTKESCLHSEKLQRRFVFPFLFKYPNSCSRMQEMRSKSPKFLNFSRGAYPQTPLEFHTFVANSSFSTFSYDFATYSDSHWKPWTTHFSEIIRQP